MSRWILFTVKTHLDPISELDDDTKGSLLTAINESDEHELSYKSLGNTTVLGSVVGYLDGRGGETGVVRRCTFVRLTHYQCHSLSNPHNTHGTLSIAVSPRRRCRSSRGW